MTDPRHREVVRGGNALDGTRLHVEKAEVRVARLARQAGAEQDGDDLAVGTQSDAPAEEHLDGPRITHGELAGVLEEERPLLRKEQVEAVEVDLKIVDLDLREVGVVGCVEGQAGSHAVLEIHTELAVRLRLGNRHRKVAQGLSQNVRGHLQVALRGWIDAAQRPCHREAVEVELPLERRPIGGLVPSPDVALEVEPPDLLLSLRETKRLERQSKLGAPAVVADLGADVPIAIPVEIEPCARPRLLPPPAAATRSSLVRDLAVVLDAGRIRSEHEAVALVAEGVEDDLKAVALVERRVATALRDDDAVRLRVQAHDAEVDRLVGEHDANLSSLRRGSPRVGRRLKEAGEHLGPGPRGVVGHVPVDERRLTGSGGRPARPRTRLTRERRHRAAE